MALFLFFPLGVVLLWLRSDWSLRRRSIITAATVSLVVVVAVLSPPAPQRPVASQARPTVSPTATPRTPHRTASVKAPAPLAKAPTPRKPSRPAPRLVAHPAVRHPTPPSEPTCGAPQNPDRLNLCGRGHLVTNPPADVCDYFPCIENFDNGVGYMVECNDGMYSMSGGRRGRCSDHGGGGRPVTQG